MITSLPTQFGDSTSGIGALGLNGEALAIQLVTFLVAFWVLKRYAFGPIIKLMAERRKLIEQGVELGEQMKKDKAALDAKVAEQLAEARKEADGIIAGANETSRQMVREAEDKARAKAEGVIKEAEERIASETKRARKQLEGELVSLISDATEAIIGEKVDATKDAQLIDRALQEQKA
ncbi:MAG TPA: F0F1 ATP synthase subunit B [Candidatus Saccharimonadales bacterium]|nr:F0F1 ATP synthase subunit B [Candidatus Saccharimonadales bacterium]